MTKPKEPSSSNSNADNKDENKDTTSTTDEKSKEENFLSTMTFANTYCDCDECGTDGCGVGVIPQPIADAVRNKRLKLDNMKNVSYQQKCQERTLVDRSISSGVSIWKWILPVGAEPIIEYGNSHRVLFVDSIHENAKIKSIGQGIIGSSDEEKSRTQVNWTEKQAYMMKCSGGKALGWVHELQQPQQQHDDDDEHENKGNDNPPPSENDVVLYMIKITPKALLQFNNNNNSKKDYQHKIQEWVKKSIEIFNKLLLKEEGGATNTTADLISSNNALVKLEEDDALTIMQFLASLIASSDT